MKLTITFILTFILAFTSCKGESNSRADDFVTLHETDPSSNSNCNNELNKKPTLEYYPVYNDKQQVIGAYPFPSDWYLPDEANDSLFIQNASGAKVFKSRGEYFTDFRSSKLNKENIPWVSTGSLQTIETIIKEKFIPYADSLNIELTNQFEIPEFEEILKKNSSLYYSLIKPKESIFKVVATEWLDNKGIKSIVVLIHNTHVFENETIWGYSIDVMDVSIAHFNASKETFLYGLKNYKNCFQHIYNQNKVNRNIDSHNNYTHVYYTKEERQKRADTRRKEDERTGMFSKNFDEYLKFLKSKGFLTDMDPKDICNLKDYYKKEEEDAKPYIDRLYHNPYPYYPVESETHRDWIYNSPKDSNEVAPSWDENIEYIKPDAINETSN